jgi:integrase
MVDRIERQKSARYFEAMKLHLGRFKDAFHCQLSDVIHERIEAWMDDLGITGRYFNNCRAALITFFKFCRKRRFLPGDLETEPEKIEKRSEIQQAVPIFSPEEMAKVLAEIRQDLVPYLVLSAFGGLRPSEARRLDWSDIHWDGKDKHIEIHATVARKTLRDRFVPLQPNLKAWLLPHRQDSGPVAGYKRPHEMLTKALKDLDCITEWPNDVLRHSFGSYRLAVLGDINKVASEMGNSPQVIVQNYRRPVSKADGKRWFKIMPKKT